MCLYNATYLEILLFVQTILKFIFKPVIANYSRVIFNIFVLSDDATRERHVHGCSHRVHQEQRTKEA